MPAPVMRDAPVSPRRQKEHLIFKRIRAQRPTMTEHHRLTLSPVVVINLDVPGTFLANGNVRHGNTLLSLKSGGDGFTAERMISRRRGPAEPTNSSVAEHAIEALRR